MRTMKAAVVHEFGKPLKIEEVPVPEVVPGQDRCVKIAASGVCHTDLHAADGDWPVKPSPPFIPGHEGVGHVGGCRSRIKHVKEGDRVGVPWLHTACGHCEHCITGWETLCDRQQMTGYTVNGGYAEYRAWPILGTSVNCPANIGFSAIAPILCAGVTVYKGLKVLDCRPGRLGCDFRCRVGWATSRFSMRRRWAFTLRRSTSTTRSSHWRRGLAPTWSSTQRQVTRSRNCRASIQGAHGVLVTAASRAAFSQALGMLHKRGTMSMVGLPPGDFGLPIFDVVLNAKAVRGSIVGTRKDLQKAWPLRAKARYTPSTAKIESKTSTRSSTACAKARSRAGWCCVSQTNRSGARHTGVPHKETRHGCP